MLFFTLSKRIENMLLILLAKAERLNNMKLFKIINAILLKASDYSVQKIASVLNVGQSTVYEWITSFLSGGLRWLKRFLYKARGRKSKLTSKQKARLYSIIEKGPEAYGFQCGIWTSAMVSLVIEKEFSASYNVNYIPALLSKIGLTYQRAKFVSDKDMDPDWHELRDDWDNRRFPNIVKQAKKTEGVILFLDEVGFSQWGSLARTWSPRGKQPVVRTSGKRKGIKYYGAIDLESGKLIYQECDGRLNQGTFIIFLRKILKKYDGHVYLIIDGAPYHDGLKVKKFLNENSRLHVEKLPPYSPDKNPIEKLWKKVKNNHTHCRYFESIDDLRETVLVAFKKYMRQAKEIISLMDKIRKSYGFA